MKIKMALSALLLSLLILSLDPARASTNGGPVIKFEDLAKLVLEKNETVEAAKFRMKAASERTGRLARSFLPQVSSIAGQEQFKTGSARTENQEYWKLEASVNLYKGGRDKLEDKIRDSQLNLSKTALSLDYQKELKNAQLAYWKIIGLSIQITDRTEAIKLNESNLKSAKRKAGAGLTTSADAKQFELHKILLTREISKLELEKDLSLNQLAAILALDEHKNIELDKEFPKVTEKDLELTQFPFDQQLTVKAQRSLESIEQLKADQSSKWWQPKVDIYAGYGLPSLSDEYERVLGRNNQWTTGLRMTLDLGQGFEDQKEAQARQAEATSFRKSAAHTIRKGKALDYELKHSLRVLADLIKTADQDIQVALSLLKLMESEYNRGVKNGTDLLEAIKNYFELRDQRTEYLQSFFSTKAEIESLVAKGIIQ